MYKQLNINNYKTHFILGNNEDEKLKKREVIINISLRFTGDNKSCNSDDLRDTVCYATLIDFLESKLQNASFNLIEKAAQFIYESVGEYVGIHIQRKVEVVKTNPPVSHLESVSFVISDW